jgi:predicted DNA-binding transcriptional regulator YafY
MNNATRTAVRRFAQIDAEIGSATREGRVVGIRRLARETEVHARTVSRDIAFLRLFFAAPIEYDPRMYGYRYGRPWRLFNAEATNALVR